MNTVPAFCAMAGCLLLIVAVVAVPAGGASSAELPRIRGVCDAMGGFITKSEISGAVTLVAMRDKIVHLDAAGLADLAAQKPMRPDTIFWIASMTKPITATAVLMLQDEGKLSVDDFADKYLPELANLKAPAGQPVRLTLRHLLTHTSGLPEATLEHLKAARTLADLIPHYARQPLYFEPGSRWAYSQSSINSLARIVEVISGQSFPDFLQKRLFDPLGMKDTTFYLAPEQLPRLAKSYKSVNGKLEEAPIFLLFGHQPTYRDRHPAANGGLFSTAPDYARFAQLILNSGSLDGKQYVKPESVKLMTTIHTGQLKTGFTDGNGWGLGWCVVGKPQGVTAMLSPGTFGHGGAYGTQVWIDPVKQVAYILMVQRADFPNADGSDVRRDFQAAAASAIAP